jgi:hypothetical protein
MVPIMCQELFGALGVKMWSEEQNLVVCVYVCEYLCVCVCVCVCVDKLVVWSTYNSANAKGQEKPRWS